MNLRPALPAPKAAAKWILIAALVGFASLAAMHGLRAGTPRVESRATRFKEVLAERGPFRLAVAADGVVRPIDRVELKSKASGEVIELPIEVGSRVEQGVLVAKLDQVQERINLAQARADLQIARAELGLAEKNAERRRELFERSAVSALDLDETELELARARGTLVRAQAALERAEELMDDTVIIAPIDGVILQKYVERGQIIASGILNVGGGTPIADIADMSTVHVAAGVDEIDIGQISLGQTATVRAEAFPQEIYTGEVVRIAPEAREEQNVTVFDVVVAVANTTGHLKSGMNASVEVVIQAKPDVVSVPVTALQISRAAPTPQPFGDATVFVKNGSDFAPQVIRIGQSDQRSVEVLEGLEGGETLGIPMHSRLKEDSEVLSDRIRQSRSFSVRGAGEKRSGGRRSTP